MSSEAWFRIAFWVLFGGLVAMQIYFARRVQQKGERVTAGRAAIEREGWGYVVVRSISSLALIAFLVFYPKLMVAQVMLQLENTVVQMEKMSAKAKRGVIKKINKKPDKKLKSQVNNFMEFFAIFRSFFPSILKRGI